MTFKDFIPMRKTIVFESKPDFSDNTRAVFDEMIRRKINYKYKLVWFVEDGFVPPKDYKNVKFVRYRNRFLYLLYRSTSKVIIACNRTISSINNKQISFYLNHGTPLKQTSSYYRVPSTFNYMLVAGEGVKNLYSQSFKYPIEKMVATGFPRNDILVSSHIDMGKLFGNYDKYVLWYPTVRNGVTKNAIPLIHNSNVADKLNDIAKKYNILIILKPHFAQDISVLSIKPRSNICIINDQFFVNNNIRSYELAGSSDALLTDYSSIYFDYLLCDKPIGLIWEDYEEYKNNNGVPDDFEHYTRGGEKIYSIEDLDLFIQRLVNNQDLLQVSRREVKIEANEIGKQSATDRATDFILKISNIS